MVNSWEIFARKIQVGGHDIFTAIFMQDVRTGIGDEPIHQQNRAQIQRSPNIKKVHIWILWPGSVIFLVKTELGKKAGCSLSTKSLCPCIVLSFKCTVKAPLIIKDWFKRAFHNLSKQWNWLMLHIISSCHLLLLCVYCASHSPSVPARICSREAGPPGLMAQLQPWVQQQQPLDWLWKHNPALS